MDKARIDEFIGHLAKISAFLVEIKYRIDEFSGDNKTVEQDLDGFFNSPQLQEKYAVLKLNREKSQGIVFSKKEVENLPFLKDLKYRITKDGIHQFRYRRDGYNVSFNSKKFEIAKKKAYAFILSLKQNKLASDNQKGYTVDSIAELWFELKKRHWADGTYRAYFSTYKNHIGPIFGKRSIKRILPIDLQPFFNELFAKAEKRCEDAKIVLNGIFKYAVANRIISSNPLDGVIVERHYRKNGVALTDEQLVRFKKTMLEDESVYGIAGLIILYTGIRGAELESLVFDWEQGTLRVKNAILKKRQKTNPKNLYRTLPIFPALWPLRSRIESEDWRIKPITISNKFKLHWPENTVKDLRHTFSSKVRESGVENELVNLWMGHLPGKNLTANVYTHFSMDYQKREAEKVRNY